MKLCEQNAVFLNVEAGDTCPSGSALKGEGILGTPPPLPSLWASETSVQ
jgi:hypothetical protein